MKFMAVAETDIGISKQSNQDSVLIKHATYDGGEVLMTIVCDGMGGLSKGELASAAVIRRFSDWFDLELCYELDNPDLNLIGDRWATILSEMNGRIQNRSRQLNLRMGTTFCGVLLLNDEILAVNVGDSRAYRIDLTLTQITTDHSFVAREVSLGNMTPQQAKVDRRRNLLLQCVGASESIAPEIITGLGKPCCYLLCSDGFHHELDDAEIINYLNPDHQTDKNAMHRNLRDLIQLDMQRGETDNITAILVKAN